MAASIPYRLYFFKYSGNFRRVSLIHITNYQLKFRTAFCRIYIKQMLFFERSNQLLQNQIFLSIDIKKNLFTGDSVAGYFCYSMLCKILTSINASDQTLFIERISYSVQNVFQELRIIFHDFPTIVKEVNVIWHTCFQYNELIDNLLNILETKYYLF